MVSVIIIGVIIDKTFEVFRMANFETSKTPSFIEPITRTILWFIYTIFNFHKFFIDLFFLDDFS